METLNASALSELVLETFLDLVRLDSPSGHEGPVRDYLVQRLNTLSLSPQVDSGGNIIVRLAGSKPDNRLTLLMTGHMDVVPPCIGVQPIVSGEGDACVIHSSGDTVLGADDKAGLAPMLEALRLTISQNLPHPNLLFIFTVDEEVNLNGAKRLNPAAYTDADFAIALDHTGEQGTIIFEAPSYKTFEMTIHGSADSPVSTPIQALSQTLNQLSFGRLDNDTTANVGFIQGGDANPVGRYQARAQGEIRSHQPEVIEAQIKTIDETLAQTLHALPDTTGTLTTAVSFVHYRTESDHPCLQRVITAMEKLALPVQLIRTNGGSDVNVFAENGVPGIVLSAGYINPHALTEHVYLKDMVTCCRLLISIWEEFAQ